jgi:hypothetical protein
VPKGKYRYPTKFCVAPAMCYGEVNGRPVSTRVAVKAMTLRDEFRRQCHPYWFRILSLLGQLPYYIHWRETEVARELHLYIGWFEEE